jgi:hypothetical protein
MCAWGAHCRITTHTVESCVSTVMNLAVDTRRLSKRYLMATKSSLISGVFSFFSALASIWRIRSRVTDKL